MTEIHLNLKNLCDFGMAATSVIIENPVVVNPDADSKMLSVILLYKLQLNAFTYK